MAKANYSYTGKDGKTYSVGGSSSGSSSSSTKTATPTATAIPAFNIMDYVTPGKEAEAQAIISGGTNSLGQKAPIGPNDTVTQANYGSVLNYLSPYMTSAAQQSVASGKEPISISELNNYSNKLSLPTQPTIPTYNPLAGMENYNAKTGLLTTPPATTESNISAIAEYMKPERGIDTNQAMKDYGVTELANKTRDLEAQINNINANAQVAMQTLESQAGAGKDVTGEFLGRQQQEIQRQASIKTTPLVAQYQAEIGNLNAAREMVNTFIAEENAYQDRLYQWKSSVGNMIMAEASKQEQRQWDLIDQANAQASQELKDFNADKKYYANLVIDKDPSLLKSIMGATSQQELASYVGQVQTPSEITGADNTLQLSQAQGNIQNITDILSSGGLSSSVGTNFLSRAPQGFWGSLGAVSSVVGIPSFISGVWKKATGQQQNFISGVEQLQSQLSLDSLIQAKAKGATFGALSDTEMRILSASASKLGTWVTRDSAGNAIGYNTTETNFKKELDKINNFAKLDYILKGGNPGDVNVVMQADGLFATENSDGTYSILK